MKFGDTVQLVDGRCGQVTFVSIGQAFPDEVRFVATGASWQCWEWVPAHQIASSPPVAARCSCGAVVYDVTRKIFDGFIAQHQLALRSTCSRLEFGFDLDELARRLDAAASEQGVLALW